MNNLLDLSDEVAVVLGANGAVGGGCFVDSQKLAPESRSRHEAPSAEKQLYWHWIELKATSPTSRAQSILGHTPMARFSEADELSGTVVFWRVR